MVLCRFLYRIRLVYSWPYRESLLMSKGNKPPKNDKAKMKPKALKDDLKKAKSSTGNSGLFSMKNPK